MMSRSLKSRVRPITHTPLVFGFLLMAVMSVAAPAGAADPLPKTIEFNRDIRPILSENCFQCHGPDKAQRKAGLRLDSEAGAFAEKDGVRALVAGDLAKSELFRRITSDDADERMPPADSKLELKRTEIDLIRLWITQGAKWQKHWAFIAPRQPARPPVKHGDWIRNGIDAFVLARLESEGLQPSAEADRTTLIRRVTLDLTGLPPTPGEVDAFLADKSDNAYGKLVDRLLKSSRYGERMANRWLDAARYADTSGYQNDGPRYMWRWRDWVIEAFNKNMPFDQFTIEQIAGDMLPNPTLDQRIATGFNRNHRGNAEGGIIPEEYAVEYVVDRVDTTSTVFLGLTLGCARCHDHKFDPITQKDFYRIFAYFNNLPESGRAIKEGNSPPYIKAPTRDDTQQLKQLERKLASAESRFRKLQPEITAAQTEWEKSFLKTAASEPVQWSVHRSLIAHFDLDDNTKNSATDESKTLASAKIVDGDVTYGSGRFGKTVEFDGRRFVDAGDIADFGYFDKFSFGAWVYPEGNQGGTLLSRMTDVYRADGYYAVVEDGHIQVNLVKRWLDDSTRVETKRKLAADRWSHVMVTYDGSRVAGGIKVYVDGDEWELKVNLDGINQTFASKEPLRIGAGNGPEGRFHGRIDEVRVYNDHLSADEVQLIATPDSINEIVTIAAKTRTDRQSRKLREYYLANHAPKPIQQAHEQVVDLRSRREQFIENLPTVMVMLEMEQRRDTFMLIRGEYDKHGEKVSPGVPASLAPLPKNAPNNRLGFAKWLVDQQNPLTARVTVNRYWQMFFGIGIVKTTEDFGTQGEPPSHQDLLDWLATEFIRSGWDIKALQKTIVMSAAYRQSSKLTRALHELDPENRLLARGPRFRLPAATIRDQALAVSGLLHERIGGPSVRPYQPAGLWKEIATDVNYNQSQGPDLYRRSVYTYWKRTVAPPTMMTFDASARETCVVRPSRTNTPLQALAMMNDVTFVEAARVLAERVMTTGGKTADERIAALFRLATARRPNDIEAGILRRGLEQHLKRYRDDKPAALKLVSSGDSKRNGKLDVSELAAYTVIASLIMNLDETITKQ